MIHFTKKTIALLFIISSIHASAQWTVYNNAANNTSTAFVDEPTSIKISPLGTDIWIATRHAGIVTCNAAGTTWSSFDFTTTGFPNNSISNVYLYGASIFASSFYNGIGISSNGTTWVTKNKSNTSNGLIDDDVREVTYDANGYLWYVTDEGLSVDSTTKWRSFTTSNAAGMATNHLTSLFIDNQNTKWIGTNGAGLLKLTTTGNIYTWTTYNTSNSSIPSNYINKIVTAADGKLYIATDAGLAVFDKNSTWTVYNHTNTDGAITIDTINDVTIDNQANYYLATSGGLVLKSAANVWVRFHTGNTTFPENAITAVAVNSSSGDIWVGTRFSGVAKNNRSKFLSTTDAVINSDNIGLYPNPTEGEINIALELKSSSEEIVFSVIDIAGREVINFTEKNIAPGAYSKTINLTAVPAGIYLLRINTTGQLLTKRIIKY